MREVFFIDHEGNTTLSRDELQGIRIKGVSKVGELDSLEQQNISNGIIWLTTYKKNDVFSTIFVNTLHSKLFGDIWSWAGKFRRTEKNIGVPAEKIGVRLHNLLENCRTWIELDSYQPIEILARLHHGLVFIHPYSNGNGRWARILTTFIAKKYLQIHLCWREDLDPKERRVIYIKALRSADQKDFLQLIKFFNNKC